MALPPDALLLAETIASDPAGTLLAVDYDGTLAPIVSDPESALADPAAMAALARLGATVRVVVITGRPALTAVRLGGMDRPGLEDLVVHGQYGAERWEAGVLQAPPLPEGMGEARADLDVLLADHPGVSVEDKGRALGIHTRNAADPEQALADLTEPVSRLATRHDLVLEPGRLVLEIRPTGSDKGAVIRELMTQWQPRQVIFVGDDLGDLPAFEAVSQAREAGQVSGWLVCSGSAEQPQIAEAADIVLPGTVGVAAWLTAIADLLAQAPS